MVSHTQEDPGTTGIEIDRIALAIGKKRAWQGSGFVMSKYIKCIIFL